VWGESFDDGLSSSSLATRTEHPLIAGSTKEAAIKQQKRMSVAVRSSGLLEWPGLLLPWRISCSNEPEPVASPWSKRQEGTADRSSRQQQKLTAKGLWMQLPQAQQLTGTELRVAAQALVIVWKRKMQPTGPWQRKQDLMERQCAACWARSDPLKTW